jgi:hypothetical protein
MAMSGYVQSCWVIDFSSSTHLHRDIGLFDQRVTPIPMDYDHFLKNKD